MDIQEVKKFLKDNNITYQELSEKSGIALNTLKNIFSGRTEHPRIDTWNTILNTLGINKKPQPNRELREDEKELVRLMSMLTQEELEELNNYISFIMTKRK